jgi:hypothetical protein
MGRARGCCLGLLALASCGRFGFEAASLPSDSAGVNDGKTGDGTGIGDDGGNGACPAFAIFCEDFESGSLAQWPMTELVGAGASATITAARPHAGTRSLEAQVPPAGSSGAACLTGPIGTHSSGVLATRAWVYGPVSIQNFDLVLGLSDAANNNYTVVGGDNSVNWVGSEVRASGSPIDFSSTMQTTANQWLCVELVFMFGATPHYDVYVDGTQVLSKNALTPSPTYNTLRVGAVRADNIGFHVFIDDVAVATQRVGCN